MYRLINLIRPKITVRRAYASDWPVLVHQFLPAHRPEFFEHMPIKERFVVWLLYADRNTQINRIPQELRVTGLTQNIY